MMITRVLMQTLALRNLEAGVAAFRDELSWEVRAEGEVAPELALVWRVRAFEHRRFAIVAPPGAPRGFIRLVEGPEDDATGTFHKRGLFNAELMSKDVDALFAKLQGSRAFTTLSSLNTYDLSGAGGGAVSRSFATRGPGGAGLFFTQYLRVPPPRTLPVCDHLAGPMFNAAVATPTTTAPVESFYTTALGMGLRLSGRLTQASVNRIIGLPDDWAFLMLVYKGEGDGLIEIDVHEHEVPDDRAPEGRLRPGNSVLTLEAAGVEEILARVHANGFTASAPRAVAHAPYDGRRVGLAIGPAGERIELVETR